MNPNEKPNTDTANEPVDTTDDGDFMDTGVLHKSVRIPAQRTEEKSKERE